MKYFTKTLAVRNGLMLVLLSAGSALQVVAAAPDCPAPSLNSQYTLSLPCVGVAGIQYQTSLEYAGNDQGAPVWTLGPTALSECAWSYDSCATTSSDGALKLINFSLDGVANNATLQQVVKGADQPLTFKYVKHHTMPTKSGQSDSLGTLRPYQHKPSLTANSNAKKLMAIYMVGSDLESSWNQAATLDLKELLAGYQALTTPDIEVVVAFGGADKEGWRGMTIATIQQLQADAEDGQFGNASDYLYQEPRAHMGDPSSLTLFLSALKQTYGTIPESFLAFWDHGGAYNGFGLDENYNNDSLSLQEIQQALQAGAMHFSLIGFDACLMASAEVANYLQQSADYLLSSEEIEPGHGWNWTNMLTLYAAKDDLITRATSMIDSYIDSESHAYKSSGKTLSLVDLSAFNAFKEHTNAFLDSLTVNLRQNVSTVIDEAAVALTRTRSYTESYNISIDLLDFIINMLGLADSNNPAEAELINKINTLIDASERYVIYSRHDGSRPYSYGVSINPPNNKPASASLGESQQALQKIWQQLVATDTDAPVTANQHNNVSADQANMQDSTFTEADLLALQGVINQLLSTGSISQAQYDLFYQGLDVLKNPALTAEEKFLELESIENSSRGVIPRGIFARGIYARGIAARGIAARGIAARGISARRIAARSLTTPTEPGYQDAVPFLTGERAAFVSKPAGIMPRGIKPRSAVKGTVAQFTDTHPLNVRTIYGTIRTDAETSDQLFETVAELDAYPTSNADEYFTPSWNRVWYNLTFDDKQPTQWMPLSFVKRYRENSQTLTIYSSRLQYQDGNKTYPDLAADEANKALCIKKGYVIDAVNNCVELAMLELVVDENNDVLQHKVTPFKQLFQENGDTQGVVVFDKISNQLKAGDRIRLLFETANLTTGQTGLWASTTRDAFIVFTRKPLFGKELLAFVDKDSGESLDFYYSMRATDIAGKSTTAEPQIAPVDLPACEKQLTTKLDLHAVSNNLLEGLTRIQFNSALGGRFDEANATLLTIDDALNDPVLSDKVQRLIGLLYNSETLDKVNATWVWDRVDFTQVKSVVDEITPDIDQVYQEHCQ